MKEEYAILPERIKAAFIDAIILIAAMYAISEIFNLFTHVPNAVRMVAFVLVFIVYDPFFTSRFGGTIGHSYSNITVKKDTDSTQNISFPMALIRFILKACLGWLSLLTVTGNEKKKALHDFAANSVVLEVPKN
tara:strand:+ start:13510 stop:13911 length:402 start_codon:yes stop_codon:yes gene_type:complete